MVIFYHQKHLGYNFHSTYAKSNAIPGWKPEAGTPIPAPGFFTRQYPPHYSSFPKSSLPAGRQGRHRREFSVIPACRKAGANGILLMQIINPFNYQPVQLSA